MRGTRKERKKERKKGRDPFGRYILYFAGEAETRDDSRERQEVGERQETRIISLLSPWTVNSRFISGACAIAYSNRPRG